MDPITIFGAVTGGISAASEIAEALNAVIAKAQKVKAAPDIASSTLRDVQMMRKNLEGFQNLQDGHSISPDRLSCIPLEDAKNTLLDCITSLDQLEDVVKPLADPSLDPLSMVDRLRWAMKDEKISQLSQRVHNAQNSLGLMLTIMQAEHIADIHKAILNLAEVTTQIAKDVAHLNARQNDSAHDIGLEQTSVARPASFLPGFTFEHDLERSRPYQRVPDWGREDISFCSSDFNSYALSYLSKCSLGDVSSMSVIALPIYIEDISNAQHYSGQKQPTLSSTQSVRSSASLAMPTAQTVAYRGRPHNRNRKPSKPSRLQRAAELIRSRLGPDATNFRDQEARCLQLDEIIRADEQRMRREVRILLLGTSGSGKSTIMKRMKLIYSMESGNEERLEWKPLIFNTIIEAFRLIFTHMEDLDIEFEDTTNEENMAHIMCDCYMSAIDPFPSDYLLPIKQLWRDSGVKQVLDKQNDFDLWDNLDYFCQDLDRIWDKNYVPSEQDILKSRSRSTGITETVLHIHHQTLRIFDIGSQQSERKKWIHCFESILFLLFVTDISAYDQYLLQNEDGNRMIEALMLWESIINSPWFVKSSPILLLNKMDLFREKVAKIPITAHGFLDYHGPSGDWKQSSKYFMDRFRALNRHPDREVYGHFISAHETNLLKILMGSVQDEIIRRSLKQLIL